MLNYIESQDWTPTPDFDRLSAWLNVLAEPNRLRIYHLLMEGVQCNCELGHALHMSPNLISHHMSKLRSAGLVEMERDPQDARWVYYSVNRAALRELNLAFGRFFDPARIQERVPFCGPQAMDWISEE